MGCALRSPAVGAARRGRPKHKISRTRTAARRRRMARSVWKTAAASVDRWTNPAQQHVRGCFGTKAGSNGVRRHTESQRDTMYGGDAANHTGHNSESTGTSHISTLFCRHFHIKRRYVVVGRRCIAKLRKGKQNTTWSSESGASQPGDNYRAPGGATDTTSSSGVNSQVEVTAQTGDEQEARFRTR